MEPVKKAKGASKSDSLFADVKDEYQSQYVDRRFYPPQMSISGAQEYIQDRKPRPIDLLDKAVAETAKQRAAIKVNKSVIHWYKCDLRTLDNASLAKASAKAHESKVPLICMYLYSAQDFQAHMISPARIDFILRTLEILQKDLAKLDIPLYVEKVEKRRNMTSRVIALAKEWSANHVYCNLEYEVDELRREARLVTDCLSEGIAFNPYHDTCVVDPNTLTGKTSGKPYAVYSPWFRAWIAHVQQNQKLLDPRPSPSKNPASARKAYAQLFDISMPGAQEDKKLSAEEKKRMESMWPAGEHAAHERLERFVEERVTKYSETRNFPALKSTSSLSVHFSSGTLAARTAIRTARDANTTKKLDGGDEGVRV